MGKKWRRVRLADLASAEEQARILGVLDQAKGQAAGECCGCTECSCGEKRSSEMAQVERSRGPLAPTPAPGESV